jgi:hypothetical protein
MRRGERIKQVAQEVAEMMAISGLDNREKVTALAITIGATMGARWPADEHDEVLEVVIEAIRMSAK